MAKEDFCFTYYDGDAARDKAHMTRLERGAYDDIISAQRKRGHLSIDDIKRVLSKDFEECWPSLEWILKKDAEDKYFIEWVDRSIEKMRANSLKQKEKVDKRWKKDTETIPRYNHSKETVIPFYEYENGNEDGIENEIKIELAKIKIEIDELVQKNYEDRIKSNELADHFAGWLHRLGLQSKREYFVKNPGDRNDRFDLMVFDADMQPAVIVEVKNYSRKNDYYKPLKQIGRYSKHGLPILFVPNFRTAFTRIESCLSFFSKGITDENFVFIPEPGIEEQHIDEPFAITADQLIPDATLEAAELNQFALTRNKNTEFLNHQWEVFLAERIHDPPEKRRKYQQLSDLTTYFLNWVRNKHPNATNNRNTPNGNTEKLGTSEARIKKAANWGRTEI